MMKRLAVSLSCLLFLSGCSWMSFDIPFFGDAPETVQKEERMEQPRRASASVSPEARKYLEEARKYWTGSGECVDPETAAGLLDKAIEADPLAPAPYEGHPALPYGRSLCHTRTHLPETASAKGRSAGF